MTNSEQGVENNTASSLIEQLGRALNELESLKNASEDGVQWMEIELHFRNLDATLKKKFEVLEAREREYMEKEAETHALLAEREAAVVAKEQEFLDRVQELKDAAVAVIAEAQANHQPTMSESIDGGDNKDNKLAESFPPVPLLKTYLKDSRRNSQGKGGNPGSGQGDANAQELAALKAVIRCVEEYKLEADYPLDPLRKRVAQLVKSKSDKKRNGDFGKYHQSKKPRANGGYRGFRGGAPPGPATGRQAPPVFAERIPYTGMPERYPHAGPNPYDYQVPGQSGFAQPATDQRMYYYPQTERVTTGSGSYDAAPSNYGNYMGTGMRSSHQPYM